ncbi:MAG: 6-bladed beta-propeller [Peptostreptococcaceae bacterium]|nr:6-bladed beta-propeller [Peptostreptococcaceae bacterium]
MKYRFYLLLLCLTVSLCSACSGSSSSSEPVKERPISAVSEPDDLGRTIPDIPLQKIPGKESGVGSAAGICSMEGRLVVSDEEKHQLVLLTPEGRILDRIGKLGSAPLEFNQPGDLFWQEEEKILYVLDGGNHRVQRLDKDLRYIDEISLKDMEVFAKNPYCSFVVDRNKDLYFSFSGELSPVKAPKIFCLSAGGKIQESKDPFVGTLFLSEGKVLAAESMVIEYVNETDNRIHTGHTDLYSLDGLQMEKLAPFPAEYTPSDILYLDGRCYIASFLWGLVEAFEIKDGQMTYIKTLSPSLNLDETTLFFPYKLTSIGDRIYVSVRKSGDIYVLRR